MPGRRKVVRIDEEKCNGCRLCVNACAEGAIEIVNGKARLASESYCDGLGNCLGTCPQGAITIEEREAEEFDEEKVRVRIEELKGQSQSRGCPGSTARLMRRTPPQSGPQPAPDETAPSCLINWPVQLKLVSTRAANLRDADVLLAADCVPFAFAGFHGRFLKGKPVIIGCPKLDDAGFYVEKLTELVRESGLRSVTVIHMEVPCCTGLVRIAEAAAKESGREVPVGEVTISIRGEVLGESAPAQRTR